jgi:hypothetical protein
MAGTINIEEFKNRIYADPVSILQPVSEFHGFSVHQNKIYFSVGNSERLDHFLYRPSPFEMYLKVGLSPVLWQKLVEFFIKPENCF